MSELCSCNFPSRDFLNKNIIVRGTHNFRLAILVCWRKLRQKLYPTRKKNSYQLFNDIKNKKQKQKNKTKTAIKQNQIIASSN